MKRSRNLLWTIIGLLVVTSMLLTACGGDDEEAAEDVTIKVLLVQGPLADGLVGLNDTFTEETGIKVETVPLPNSDMFAKINSLALSKSSEVDVIFADDPWMPNIASTGLSVNLTEEYGATRDTPDVTDVSYDVFSWPPPYGPIPKDFQTGESSDLHALVVQGNVIMFYVRKDILDERGLDVPETWQDVLDIAEQVHCPDCDPPLFGYNVRGNASSDQIALLWSLGGDIFDDDFNVIIDNEAGCAAFELYEKLAKYLPPGGNTYGTTEMVAEVVAGRAMAGIGWPGDAYAAFENEVESEVAGKMHYMPLPAAVPGGPHVSMIGHWGLVLNSYSEHKEAAWKYIEWMHYNENQAIEFARAGGIPFRESVFLDPELVKEKPWFEAQFAALKVPPKWRPRSTQATGIAGSIIQPAFSAIGAGELTGAQACKQAGEEIRAAMEGVTN
jgi:multiple sugar transport system substrate-binding protein